VSETSPGFLRGCGVFARRHLLPLLCVVLVALATAVTLWQFRVPSSASGLGRETRLGLRPGLMPNQRLTAQVDETDPAKCLRMYLELTGRKLLPITNGILAQLDERLGGRLSRWRWISPAPRLDSGITYHGDGLLSAAETKIRVESALRRAKVELIPVGRRYLRIRAAGLGVKPVDSFPATNGSLPSAFTTSRP